MAAVTSNRKDDWRTEFYKNGYPNEVIVIEDSPTPPKADPTTTNTIVIDDIEHLPPAASTRSKRSRRDQPVSNNNTQLKHIPAASNSIRKRRKITNTAQGNK